MDNVFELRNSAPTVKVSGSFVQDTNTMSTESGRAHEGPRPIIQHCLYGLSRRIGSMEVLCSRFMTTQFTFHQDSAAGCLRRLAGVVRWVQPRQHPTPARLRKELFQARGLRVTGSDCGPFQRQRSSMSVSLLCGLRGSPAAIFGQFSSSLSSLFARGRRTTGFLQMGCAA